MSDLQSNLRKKFDLEAYLKSDPKGKDLTQKIMEKNGYRLLNGREEKKVDQSYSKDDEIIKVETEIKECGFIDYDPKTGDGYRSIHFPWAKRDMDADYYVMYLPDLVTDEITELFLVSKVMFMRPKHPFLKNTKFTVDEPFNSVGVMNATRYIIGKDYQLTIKNLSNDLTRIETMIQKEKQKDPLPIKSNDMDFELFELTTK